MANIVIFENNDTCEDKFIIEEVRDMENYYRGPKGRDDN